MNRAHVIILAAAAWLVSAPATGASYRKSNQAKEREQLIAKLSSDINKVDHSIDVTKDLIKRSPDAPYLADLVFRLAELYVERSRYVYARLMEQRPEGQQVLEGEKALEVQISKRLAIETYERILKEYPEFDRNDQVRFFRAHEYRELGEFEEMLKAYQELIEKHPRSDWAIEARLILGDHHFDKGEINAAEKFYEGVLQLPESHLHDMARYKLGWIRINQEKFADSLKLFEAAVISERKKKRGAIGDARSLDVKREAMLASVWPFSEVKKPYQAAGYYRKLAESKSIYLAALKKLADRYFVKTEYPSSALLYREIVPLSADVEENIEYVQRIYESVRNMSKRNPARYANAAGDVDAIVTTVARFQNAYKYSDEEKKKLRHDLEVRARDLATQLHAEAQRKKDAKKAQVAAEAYRQYLSLFTDAEQYPEIQLNRASALNEAESYLEAGRQYERIALKLEDGPKRREMLYDAIAAYHRSLDEDTVYRRKHPTKPGLLNKLELLRGREGLKQLGAYYVKTWPKDKNVPAVKFNVATMYYQQGHYEKASELFTAYVEEYPTSKDASTAGNLALDALNKMDDLERLAKQAAAFAQNTKIADAGFRKQAEEIAKAARKRNVEMTVIDTTEGDFSERMLSEWEKHKDSAEGEDFLYTAFVKYKNEANVAGVYDFGGRMIGAYPESPRLVDVFGTMGAFAVRAADFERAAFMFEEYSRRFPQEANANQLLTSAGSIRLMLGEYDKAAEAYRRLRKGGNATERMTAHEKLMEVYREARDWEALARVAQTALQDNNNWLGAAFHLGLAYLEQGKQELAQRELARAAQLQARTDFDQQASGRLNFELGRLLHTQYDEIVFRDVASSQQVLSFKLQYLEAMEQSYIGAISSGDGFWGIPALHGLARAYQEFGKFIAGAPIPDGMSRAERTQYQNALKQEGQQYEGKARQTLEACQQKARELKVFNAYATACLAGSISAVDAATTRSRSRLEAGEGYKRELAALRDQLVKKPEATSLMIDIARKAVSVGDYHLALLTLSKAAETDPRSPVIQNLLGVTHWHLGDHQSAFGALQKASRAKLPEGAANLGALYQEFGYAEEADAALGSVEGGRINLSSPDVHPRVRVAMSERGRS